MHAFFEHFPQIAVVAVVATGERINPFVIFGNVGPVIVDAVALADARGFDDVGSAQRMELVADGVADGNAEAARRVVDVDVPIVDAAVDHDVSQHRLGGVVVDIADRHHSQGRHGEVPILSQGDFGTLNAGRRDLPIGLQPIRVADHQDHSVGVGF